MTMRALASVTLARKLRKPRNRQRPSQQPDWDHGNIAHENDHNLDKAKRCGDPPPQLLTTLNALFSTLAYPGAKNSALFMSSIHVEWNRGGKPRFAAPSGPYWHKLPFRADSLVCMQANRGLSGALYLVSHAGALYLGKLFRTFADTPSLRVLILHVRTCVGKHRSNPRGKNTPLRPTPFVSIHALQGPYT